jgi:hypothetical protein
MAVIIDYEVGGSIEKDAYLRVEHLSGSKVSGWHGIVYVLNAFKEVIIDTFEVDAVYNPAKRGYESLYETVREMYPECINV